MLEKDASTEKGHERTTQAEGGGPDVACYIHPRPPSICMADLEDVPPWVEGEKNDTSPSFCHARLHGISPENVHVCLSRTQRMGEPPRIARGLAANDWQ
jgi:hypothetical protein